MTIQEIKEIMKEKDISQIELSEKSNIPLQTLRKIFSGVTKHPRIDTMQAIEKALELDPDTQSVTEPNDTTTPATELNANEERVITAYRNLVPGMQDYILEMIEKLVNADKDSKTKKA